MKNKKLAIWACCVILVNGAAWANRYSMPARIVETRHARVYRRLEALDPEKVAAAWQDMARRWPNRFEKNPEWLRTLEVRRELAFSNLCADWGSDKAVNCDGCCGPAEKILAEVRAHLLENPLLDFGRILAVRRPESLELGLHHNDQQPRELFEGSLNCLGILSNVRAEKPTFTALDVTDKHGYIGEVCLHWDANKVMYTRRTGRTNCPPRIAYTTPKGWKISNRAVENIDRVYELDLTAVGAKPCERMLIPDEDCNCYAGAYLPDGGILFLSDATMVGVPCVVGTSWVASIYRQNVDKSIRRLTFDQDNSWHPYVLDDGRILFQHWEYTDIVHFASRRLYTMNPDGTRQRAYYGTESFWPNALFRARPCPDAPTRFTAIVSGHHGQRQIGELFLFDVQKGDSGTNGVVRRFIQPGVVKPLVRDRLTDFSWPKFASPAPLSQDYVLVASRPTRFDGWGLYLVDAFGNATPIVEEEGFAYFEITPLVVRKKPPVLADSTSPSKIARVSITDIYAGRGLEDVPRGTVKKLRVFTYSFAYREMGAERDQHGLDGPWDIKRILGTVPVEDDGSAHFEVPANTPLAVQPLNERGEALQTMRSWFNAMPGEHVSCVGCHERTTDSLPPTQSMKALKHAPAKITPWYGPERGLDFRREVAPVLTRYCVACHDGQKQLPDLTDRPDACILTKDTYYMNDGKFPPAYVALCSYVRSLTREGDNRMLVPCEAAANTTALMQMLDAGHQGVCLDAESRDRLVTWIDLGRMGHGAWSFCVASNRVPHYAKRRQELQRRYANLQEDHEHDFGVATLHTPALKRKAEAPPKSGVGRILSIAPFTPRQRTLDLGGGIQITFVRIPAGHFISAAGRDVTLSNAFWLSTCEISNEQLRRIFPTHESGLENNDFMKFSLLELGYSLNDAKQPAVRISANRAQEFCVALSCLTQTKCRLPSGDEWEWAARAGAQTPLPYGTVADDFSHVANLADATFRRQDKFSGNVPLMGVPPWRLADTRFDDTYRVTAPCGTFKANKWGLFDMVGNVWEWTLDRTAEGNSLARGGSFWSRPQDATFSKALHYPPWQRVHDVGFRICLED